MKKAPNQPDIKGKQVHFIGIGGCGMCGLAEMVLADGGMVSGSDSVPSGVTGRLEGLGIRVFIGHRPENILEGVSLVVATAAARPDNVEVQEAARRGIETIKYAQMLGRLMRGRRGIAVSGTHGKSTTAAMIAFILDTADMEPSFVIGADVPQLASAARAGKSDLLVVEACEYDRSFLNLEPTVAAILNIDQDHLDYYRDIGEIKEAFGDFAANVAPAGLLIANGDDAKVLDAAESARAAVETFGFGEGCFWRADGLCSRDGLYEFDLYRGGEMLGRFRLALLGRHQVMNALAAAAICLRLGVGLEAIRSALANFTGALRRMEFKGRRSGVTVLDDYAHHPTEIEATLGALREHFPSSRLWCIFQPHQYSRTRFMLKDFARALLRADKLIVPQIYFVRDSEQERKRVSSEDLVREIKSGGGDAVFVETFDGIAEFLCPRLESGDIVITMGAGPVWQVADSVLAGLRGVSGAATAESADGRVAEMGK